MKDTARVKDNCKKETADMVAMYACMVFKITEKVEKETLIKRIKSRCSHYISVGKQHEKWC